MKYLFLPFLLAVFLNSLPSSAQKENNIWAFGNKTGIDFNGSAPVAITTSGYSFESCASICDASGNLLFYAASNGVWDRTNTIMPNGSGFALGSIYSSTQGIGIIPVPDEPDKYLLFTIEEEGGFLSQGRLSYSLIDMKLNGGKGDIVSGKKNILLADSMSEKLAFAPACDGIWLLTHHPDQPIFYAFKVYSSSSIAPPVISTTPGLVQQANYTRGKAVFSSDFSQMAIASYYLIDPASSRKPSILELFDFDTKTGIVSGYSPIDTIGTTYGIEFSKNNTKLYVVCQGDRKVYQYDLSLLPSVAAVKASRYNLGPIYIDARRGPDDRIYLNTADGTNIISRINDPDNAGAACNFQSRVPGISCNGYFLNMGEKTVTFKRYVSDTVFSRKDTTLCFGQTILLRGDSTHNHFSWNDGDTSRVRTLSSDGIYLRQSFKSCTAYIDSIALAAGSSDTTGYGRLDTTFCFAGQATVKAPVAADYYRWSDGSTAVTNTFHSSETKVVYSSLKTAACSLRADTVSVSLIDFDLRLPDLVLCRDQIITLDAAVPGATYRWHDGSQASSLNISTPGQYWVTVSVGICRQTDTATISSGALLLDLGPDRQLCTGESLVLQPGIDGAAYTWQDGSTGNNYIVRTDGMYTVTAMRNGCTEWDSLRIETIKCDNCIAIPNAFTPDKDGHNDVFQVFSSCPLTQYKLIIMNRYGQEVFTAEDINKTWNGSFNNQLLDAGVYYYLLKVRYQHANAAEQLYKGDISLLR